MDVQTTQASLHVHTPLEQGLEHPTATRLVCFLPELPEVVVRPLTLHYPSIPGLSVGDDI
jgi:hypothetical protein